MEFHQKPEKNMKPRSNPSPVAQETARTLGGTAVFWSQPLSGGRPVTLGAQDAVTWLNRGQVTALYAMASDAGGVFLLEWEDEVFHVMFRHQDYPATQFVPIFPHRSLYTGTIKLMTV
ncbi:MAG: hypothetical protein H7836_08815 [Magnetococcus sp. YQC-3]